MARSLNGNLRPAVVTGYDPNTMTATISPYDGSGNLSNVSCPMNRCDPVNGAYAITPPSIGSPCWYTEYNGEVSIISLFPPLNINSDANTDLKSPLGATANRCPSDMANKATLPGNSSATNSMGSEESLTDMMKKIIMSPGKLSSVWNLLNGVWENVCSIFRLKAGGMDIEAEVDGANNTNTTIRFRRTVGERAGTSVVDLQIGQNAGIINLKINGNDFLHVDAARNVKLVASTISFTASEFNCMSVDSVKLP